MKRLIAVAVTVPLIAGCVTTTVDSGPPKVGQTVARPHPAEDTMAAEKANQMQAETSAPMTGGAGSQDTAADNSIFSGGNPNGANNVMTNPPQTGQITPALPPGSTAAQQTPNSPPAGNAP